VLFECAREAVDGLPAYTRPAWPAVLNGEPGEVADAPGVIGFAEPHVLVGAPGWPVVGDCNVSPASAVAPVATVKAMTQNAAAVKFLKSLAIGTSV
jgi:hypothetical protein